MKEQEQSVQDVNIFGKCKQLSAKRFESMKARQGDDKEERSQKVGNDQENANNCPLVNHRPRVCGITLPQRGFQEHWAQSVQSNLAISLYRWQN